MKVKLAVHSNGNISLASKGASVVTDSNDNPVEIEVETNESIFNNLKSIKVKRNDNKIEIDLPDGKKIKTEIKSKK